MYDSTKSYKKFLWSNTIFTSFVEAIELWISFRENRIGFGTMMSIRGKTTVDGPGLGVNTDSRCLSNAFTFSSVDFLDELEINGR